MEFFKEELSIDKQIEKRAPPVLKAHSCSVFSYLKIVEMFRDISNLGFCRDCLRF